MSSVLYVDGAEPMRRAVRLWLEQLGIAVHTARGIASAKRCFARGPLDAAVVELWLPDGSGFELFDWIEDHHPEVADRVAFVTGDILVTEHTQRALATLRRPVLLKPFDLGEMERLVRGWGRSEGMKG